MIGFLFDALLGAPFSLVKEVLEKIRDEVDRERLITEESIRERLQELQLLVQDNEMTEDEYEALEAELLEKLRAVREYQRGI